MTDQQMIQGVVDHWCPKQFDGESFQVRTIRALLEANVTAMAAKSKIDGTDCVRPYDICTQPPASWEEIDKNRRNG